ncbi:MAG: hypothetical protein FWG62_05150 [Proteobacteria bacterium]|nr:hypothetical protein [Pseudomonadota bacterium]
MSGRLVLSILLTGLLDVLVPVDGLLVIAWLLSEPLYRTGPSMERLILRGWLPERVDTPLSDAGFDRADALVSAVSLSELLYLIGLPSGLLYRIGLMPERVDAPLSYAGLETADGLVTTGPDAAALPATPEPDAGDESAGRFPRRLRSHA